MQTVSQKTRMSQKLREVSLMGMDFDVSMFCSSVLFFQGFYKLYIEMNLIEMNLMICRDVYASVEKIKSGRLISL